MMKRIDQLLVLMTEADASDLHLKAGRPPVVRVDGTLREMEEPRLSGEDINALQAEMFTERQLGRLEQDRELDASYQPQAGGDRFRVNCFLRMGMPGVVMRRVPCTVPSLDALGFKPVLKDLVHGEQGMVMVTGPTGSGKSTTLAAMVRELNDTEDLHIVTIEDPIEFVQEDNRCLINQREVGIDTDSFAEALRRALRQDPDVILVGEMRDAETIRIATMAAETGHLVLSTLHTNDAKQSVDRIVNTFPPEEQFQIRLKLAATLRGIVSQSLLPRSEGTGRVCVQEIMVCTPFIRELIKKGDVAKIDDAIREAPPLHGMQSKNQALFASWRTGAISEQDALAFSNRPTDLDLLIRTEKFERRKTENSPPLEQVPPEISASDAAAPSCGTPPEGKDEITAVEEPDGIVKTSRWSFRR
jgi:twitching motility protein PilT